MTWFPRDFGAYTIEAELGRGGGGIVYSAIQKSLGRRVALKVLNVPVSWAVESTIQRFEREAKVMAQLSHPGIVGVHDHGIHEGTPFLCMDFIAGMPLDRWARENFPSPERSAEIVVQVARALQYAHEQGIVHRDIKPGNILMDEQGLPKLTDFGLAKRLEGPSMTMSEAILGTPLYMSPEQAMGRSHEVDARSDLYSLGAVLYEMITGLPLFLGALNLEALRHKVIHEDPVSPRKLNRRLPRDLETICMKALEKEPSKRYPSAAEFAEDLDRFRKGDPIRATRTGIVGRLARKARRNRPAALLTGILLFLVIGAGGILLYREISRRSHRRASLEATRSAAAARDWERALRSAEEGLQTHPNDPELTRLRRGAAVQREMARARAALRRSGALRARAAGLRAAIARLERELLRKSPSEKLHLWKRKDELAGIELEVPSAEAEAMESAQRALRIEERNVDASRFLAEAHFRRWEEARRDRRSAEAEVHFKMALAYGGMEMKERLHRPAVIVFRGEAEAYLFRYEERRGRLIPFPYRADTRTLGKVELLSVDPLGSEAEPDRIRKSREGTAYPLLATAFNRLRSPARVPAGSYLALFRRAGRADVRMPLLIGPGDSVERTVSPPESAPSGFVPVGSIFVGRWEVTCKEYMEFINDRGHHTREEAEKRLPRRSPEPFFPGYLARREGLSDRFFLPSSWDDRPVIGISAEDAEAYARWKSASDPKWTFRLPTSDEWTRCAAGADRRIYPWGNRFDPGFCAMKESSGEEGPLRAGLFPADESPYGSRDVGGGVMEWTSTPAGSGGKLLLVRGGSFAGDSMFCRTDWTGHTSHRDNVAPWTGFRLVAQPK